MMNLFNKLNSYLWIICLLYSSCSSKKVENPKQDDSSILREQQSFNCSELRHFTNGKRELFNIDSVGSYKSHKKVNESFYKKHLESFFKVPFHKNSLYYFSYIDEIECGLVLLQQADQTPNALYLLIFSSNGEVLSIELLAKRQSYPGSETVIRSRLLNNNLLQRIRIEGYVGDYVEKEDRYSEIIDSIYQELKILDNGLIKELDKDSVRIEK